MAKPTVTPKAPSGISRESAAVFASLTSQFDFDNAADRELLGEFVRTLDRLTQIRAAVKQHGITIAGSRKQVRPHPLLAAEDSCRRTLLSIHRALRLQGAEAY